MKQAKALVNTLRRLQAELRDAPEGSTRYDYCQQRVARCLIALVKEVEDCAPPSWCISVGIGCDACEVTGPFETKEEALEYLKRWDRPDPDWVQEMTKP